MDGPFKRSINSSKENIENDCPLLVKAQNTNSHWTLIHFPKAIATLSTCHNSHSHELSSVIRQQAIRTFIQAKHTFMHIDAYGKNIVRFYSKETMEPLTL